MTKESIYSLKRDLNCANKEAQGYLDEVVSLKKEVKELEWYKGNYQFLYKILNKLLEND